MLESCNGSEAMIAGTSDNDDYDQNLSAWILGVKSSNGSDKSSKILIIYI